MAHIVVVTHEFDLFPPTGEYLLYDVLLMLEQLGHSWQAVAGPTPAAGDVGILHVDGTRVPADYLELAPQYRVAVNFGTGDISKRHVSRALLAKGDPWPGAVIVKPDLNLGGRAEAFHNHRAAQLGRSHPYLHLSYIRDYAILPAIETVPDVVWRDPNLVVERFLPEVDPDGYALRSWVFMGRAERCTRHVARDPIVKGDKAISRSPAEVPAALRRERERLGFDFGKFDFVLHEGQAHLLDANRTPGAPPHLRAFLQDGARHLAQGLQALIEEAGVA